MEENVLATHEERLLATLAHAAVVTGMIGPVVGLLIYVTQKEKSAYAARQGLQAAIYQLAGIGLMIVAWSCWTAFYLLSMVPVIAQADRYADAPPPIFWVGLSSMICPLILMGLWGLYGLYGALCTWGGADFRYGIIGNLVAVRMASDGETAEDGE